MIQTYTIIAIVGFALAAVLAITAIIMFFALHIKQVHDDLTGKTAARSIVAIRSRAKTRARKELTAAQRLGWEHEPSSAELAGFAQSVEAPFIQEDEDEEGATAMLSIEANFSNDEAATSLFAEEVDFADDEEATTMFVSPQVADYNYDEDEAPTVFLGGMDAEPFPGGAR